MQNYRLVVYKVNNYSVICDEYVNLRRLENSPWAARIAEKNRRNSGEIVFCESADFGYFPLRCGKSRSVALQQRDGVSRHQIQLAADVLGFAGREAADAEIGFRGTLSLELFNRDYWQQDAFAVAQKGLVRMRELVEKSRARLRYAVDQRIAARPSAGRAGFINSASRMLPGEPDA